MGQKKPTDSTKSFEKLLNDPPQKKYVFRLYVAGTTPQSVRAVENIRKICEKQLHGHYRLEVIDLYQQPEKARSEQIVAAPTLVKQLPLPVRRILGDMSKTERVLIGLGLE